MPIGGRYNHNAPTHSIDLEGSAEPIGPGLLTQGFASLIGLLFAPSLGTFKAPHVWACSPATADFDTDLPLLCPGPQNHFEGPGRTVLSVQLEINVGDSIGVGHIVVLGRSSQPMGTRPIGLLPTDGSVNRQMCNVDALGHQLARHALCQT